MMTKTVLSEDVVGLAKYYSDRGADELIVFDLSDSDEEHEESIDLMRKINRVIRIPMIAGGNIKRQEDVKKILYTGAKRAVLNLSKPVCTEMLEEVSKRFGKERIAVSLNDFDALFKQQHRIEEFSSRDCLYASVGSEFRDECNGDSMRRADGYHGRKRDFQNSEK